MLQSLIEKWYALPLVVRNEVLEKLRKEKPSSSSGGFLGLLWLDATSNKIDPVEVFQVALAKRKAATELLIKEPKMRAIVRAARRAILDCEFIAREELTRISGWAVPTAPEVDEYRTALQLFAQFCLLIIKEISDGTNQS